jgi:hypothetical protein
MNARDPQPIAVPVELIHPALTVACCFHDERVNGLVETQGGVRLGRSHLMSEGNSHRR